MPLPADLIAPHDLSENEIVSRFGALLDEAVEAFRADPTYIVTMMESRAVLVRRADTYRRAHRSRVASTQPRDAMATGRGLTRAERTRQTQERRAQVAVLNAQGMSRVDICQTLGLSYTTINNDLRVLRQNSESSI